MRRIALLVALLAAAPTATWGQYPQEQFPRQRIVAPSTALPPTYREGTNNVLTQNLVGNLRTTVTQDVIISAANSSTANLAAGATFTGGAADTLGVGALQVNFIADQPVTIHCQQSMDGTNWDIDDSYTLAASAGDGRTFQATASFVRITVTNTGSAPTTFLRLQLAMAPIIEAVPRRLTNAGNFRVGIAEPLPNTVVSGMITSTQDVSISAAGLGNVRYSVTGTWTGALYFESTINGTDWIPTVGVPVPATILGGAVVASTTVNGNWESRAVAVQRFRVRGVLTSGTANVTIVGNMSTDFIIAGMIDDGVVFTTTTTPLGAGGVWQSPVIDMLPYASETMSVYANVPSATDGVLVEVSHDGATWFTDHATTYLGSGAEAFVHNRKWRYSRITYTNGATPQTTFVLQVILQRVSPQTRTAHFSQTLHDDDTAALTRSVITGRQTSVGNGYTNVTVDPTGALNVNASGLPDGLTSGWSKEIVAQHDVQTALLWPHGFNTRLVTDDSANGGSAVNNIVGGISQQNALLSTGVAANGAGGFHTNATARFTPQQAVRVVFSTRGFTCVSGNRKVLGIGNTALGYFVGCDPATGLFGVMYRNSTGDHWIARSAFNGYKFDGTTGQPTSEVWDPSLTTFYAIDYRMGTATTQFFIAFPGKQPQLIHQMVWRNSSSGTSVSEGFLPFRAENVNVGSTANNTLLVGPAALLSETNSSPVGVNYSFSHRQTAISTLKPVFSVRANSTWNGTGGPVANRVGLALQSLSFTTTGGGTATIGYCSLYLNSTLGAAPVWNDLNANNSIVATEVAATTITGGDAIFTYTLANNLVNVLDLTPYRYRLNPGETFTVGCAVDAGAAVDIRAALSWVEEW